MQNLLKTPMAAGAVAFVMVFKVLCGFVDPALAAALALVVLALMK